MIPTIVFCSCVWERIIKRARERKKGKEAEREWAEVRLKQKWVLRLFAKKTQSTSWLPLLFVTLASVGLERKQTLDWKNFSIYLWPRTNDQLVERVTQRPAEMVLKRHARINCVTQEEKVLVCNFPSKPVNRITERVGVHADAWSHAQECTHMKRFEHKYPIICLVSKNSWERAVIMKHFQYEVDICCIPRVNN